MLSEPLANAFVACSSRQEHDAPWEDASVKCVQPACTDPTLSHITSLQYPSFQILRRQLEGTRSTSYSVIRDQYIPFVKRFSLKFWSDQCPSMHDDWDILSVQVSHGLDGIPLESAEANNGGIVSNQSPAYTGSFHGIEPSESPLSRLMWCGLQSMAEKCVTEIGVLIMS